MKKAIIISLMFLTLGIVAPTTSVAATESSISVAESAAQWRRRGRRTVTRTRIVWRYGRRYREVYRITYLPNGRTRITVISRTRLRY